MAALKKSSPVPKPSVTESHLKICLEESLEDHFQFSQLATELLKDKPDQKKVKHLCEQLGLFYSKDLAFQIEELLCRSYKPAASYISNDKSHFEKRKNSTITEK